MNNTKTIVGHSLTIDVEEWFHILDSPVVPLIDQWPSLESRIDSSLCRMLDMLEACGVHATFFWLGWVAERHKDLVRKCCDAGHEIASHGYAHVLAYEVGAEAFSYDISTGKTILEDITGKSVLGFRGAGFGIREESEWAFEVIKECGYEYDSSVFPGGRGHGGMASAPLGPYLIDTHSGALPEIGMSAIDILGKRMFLFGGGYLRLAPMWLIKWGIDRLHKEGRPLVVYVHPREIDPGHPKLPLPLMRRFKCYVNLKTTMPKLKWLCKNYKFITMRELVAQFFL